MKDIVIDIADLAVGYGNRDVLTDVNLKIRAGEMVGIIGSNGAGKSTLLKTIRGLLPRRKGEIKYFGKAIDALSEKEIARLVAYLQQDININFNYTGRDIVLAGRYPYLKWWQKESQNDEELVRECMVYTGTGDLADRPVNNVSGGQRQRILLAKILAQQTPVLFLDEPATGLDMVYQEEIFRFINELAGFGKTILMVIHELNLAAKYCDRILLLGSGQVLADGTPQQVFTDELLSRAYSTDVQVIQNPVSGSLEISAKINEQSMKKGRKLLQKICR